MKRKYIDDLGIKFTHTPYGWNTDIKEDRMDYWIKQRKEFGFDERETWALDYSFKLWLYERLKMFNEINCINTNFHKFNFKGKELTQQECIDEMIKGLEISLTISEIDQTKEQKEKVSDIVNIWALCINTMWW